MNWLLERGSRGEGGIGRRVGQKRGDWSTDVGAADLTLHESGLLREAARQNGEYEIAE